jgi:hypothetical protein
MKPAFGFDTTIIPLLRDEARARFANPKALRERLFEWALGILWLVAAAVLAIAVAWS